MRRIEAREAPASLVVLNLSGSPGADLAGVRLLAQLASLLKACGIAFRLAEVRGKVRDMIGDEGLAERLGSRERGLSEAEITTGSAREPKAWPIQRLTGRLRRPIVPPVGGDGRDQRQ